MKRSALMAALLVVLGGAAAPPPADNDGARPGNVIGTGQSLPRSDQAGNLNGASTHSELAPNLPAPPAGDDIQTLLMDAKAALQAGRTGEAQEALERAESRALDRSIPAGTERVPAADPLVGRISRALQALGNGDGAGSIREINAALPEAAQADIPR